MKGDANTLIRYNVIVTDTHAMCTTCTCHAHDVRMPCDTMRSPALMVRTPCAHQAHDGAGGRGSTVPSYILHADTLNTRRVCTCHAQP